VTQDDVDYSANRRRGKIHSRRLIDLNSLDAIGRHGGERKTLRRPLAVDEDLDIIPGEAAVSKNWLPAAAMLNDDAWHMP
jgi:hypothetical protein